MATINDVARLAGVSPMTASRVVNNTGNVKPAARERVLSAVTELGYTRNHAAAALRGRGQPTWTIGLVLENVANHYQAQLQREIEEAALELGSFVLAASTEEDPARMEAAIRAFRSREVDGLVVAPPPGRHPILELIRAQGVPLVIVDRPTVGVAAPHVLSDGRKGTSNAVAHLAARGHRRIAYVSDVRSLTMKDRYAGFVDGMTAAGLPVDERHVRLDAATTEDAVDATGNLLALDDGPTAFITGRDGTTAGVVRGLHRAGMHRERALVGFDDIELADVLEPGVTVVAQDPIEVGKRAAEKLIEQLSGVDGVVEEIRVPTRLIERGSGEIPAPN